jgi:hypothetical protein
MILLSKESRNVRDCSKKLTTIPDAVGPNKKGSGAETELSEKSMLQYPENVAKKTI